MKQIELQENKTPGELEWKTERKGSLGERAVGKSFGRCWRSLEHSRISAGPPTIRILLPLWESAMARLPHPCGSEVAGDLELLCLSFSLKDGRCRLHCVCVESTQGSCDRVCPCGNGVAGGSVGTSVEIVIRNRREVPGLMYEVTRGEQRSAGVPTTCAGVDFSLFYLLVV